MTIAEHLRIYVDGTFAGDLTQNGAGRVAFEYDDAYREQEDPTPLSFVIGLRAVQHKPSHVKNWFDGLLPDNAAVREEWGRKYQVSSRNPLALLRHVGRDAAGAIQVLPAGEESDDAAARTGHVQWLTDDDLTTLLNGLRTGQGDWGREFRNGRWSLAGAQNKAALHKLGDRWGIPLDSTPTTHVVKASIGGYDLHDVNEFACQRVARHLGIPAATTTLLNHGDERAVISTRYDRARVGDVWRRIHQEDLCQALGIAPNLKYQSDGGPGLSDFKNVFARFGTPTERHQTNLTFFDYLAYNVVIGATDGHAKNFSILHVGSLSRLAPLYDLASALPYLRGERIEAAGLRTELPRSALKIGSTYDLPSISESDIGKVARILSLDPEQAVERYRDLARRTPGLFEDLAATLDNEQAQFVRDLSAKIAAHVAGRWRNGTLI